ncbi:UNVERIFIED_CONTAM: hypothetical protein HDU68_003531 [Siphonaria sp. JEL0065]|nr:hypothetical protein HDU68_003531 [Siphonaria sp. JEL0065]
MAGFTLSIQGFDIPINLSPQADTANEEVVEIPAVTVAKADYVVPTLMKDGHFSNITILKEDPLATQEFLTDRFTQLNAIAGAKNLRYIFGGIVISLLAAMGLIFLTGSMIPLIIEFFIMFVAGVTCVQLHPTKRIDKKLVEFDQADLGELTWSIETDVKQVLVEGQMRTVHIPKAVHVIRIL